MHLGNGALTPECAVISLGAAAVGLAAAAASARREPLTRPRLALAAALGGLVFAAQAVNVPVLPGISAHLVGGVLLAWVLGPGLGAWTMATILSVQALTLGDGGLAALGANVLNMALLPALCVGLCRRWEISEGRWSWVACTAAGAGSVSLAAVCVAGETAAFRGSVELALWQGFAAKLIVTHVWIGLVEGGLTLALIAALARLAPANEAATWRPALAAGGAALLVAIVAFPWSSALPDGYEAAAQATGLGGWLAEGSGAIALVQVRAVALAESAFYNQQGCLIAAMLLTAAIVAAGAGALGKRQNLARFPGSGTPIA